MKIISVTAYEPPRPRRARRDTFVSRAGSALSLAGPRLFEDLTALPRRWRMYRVAVPHTTTQEDA